MTGYTHRVVITRRPAPLTLRAMGQAATEASQSWTMREWAARLAAKAGPRDYVGQLRELYDGIVKRWRYVQEPDEWTHGSGRSLLAHVLGAKYQGSDVDPLRIDVERTPWGEHGWGDCDDVASLVAAGALSLGMQPRFRVVRRHGGAHVSTIVQTPRGEIVSLDPVGHPAHPFGWIYRPSGAEVRHYTLEGTEVPAQEDDAMMLAPTYTIGMGSLDGPVPSTPHVVAVPPWDARGPRVLGVPKNYLRLLRAGYVVDGCPAVSQFGEVFEYNGQTDVWEPEGAMGRLSRKERRARRRRIVRRMGKRVATVARVVGRVLRPLQKAVSRIASNPIVQRVAGQALAVFGVPPSATRAMLSREAEILRRGGRAKIAELIASGRTREAASMVAGSAGRALQAAIPGMAGFDDDAPSQLVFEQNGTRWYGQPVGALCGLGEIDMAQVVTAPKPTPGRWYRVQRGDTLLAVAGKAYALKSGSERLARARWINDANANRNYRDPKLTDKGLFPSGRISFDPRFAEEPSAAIAGKKGRSYALLYIPLVKGDEPPERPAAPARPLPSLPEPVVARPEPVVVPKPAPRPEPMAPVVPIPAAPTVRAPIVVPVEPTPTRPAAAIPVVSPVEAAPPKAPIEVVPAYQPGVIPEAWPTREEVPSRPRAPVVVPSVEAAPKKAPIELVPAYEPGVIPEAWPTREEVPSRPRAPVVVPTRPTVDLTDLGLLFALVTL